MLAAYLGSSPSSCSRPWMCLERYLQSDSDLGLASAFAPSALLLTVPGSAPNGEPWPQRICFQVLWWCAELLFVLSSSGSSDSVVLCYRRNYWWCSSVFHCICCLQSTIAGPETAPDCIPKMSRLNSFTAESHATPAVVSSNFISHFVRVTSCGCLEISHFARWN